MPQTHKEISVYVNMQGDVAIRQNALDGADSVIVMSKDYVPELMRALQAELTRLLVAAQD